jgi:hypothetical protein
MIDIHPWKNDIYVCHAFCWLWAEPLSKTLQEFYRFNQNHPHEVVTLILESYVDSDKVAKIFKNSPLNGHLYTHPSPQTPWPTLRELIEQKTNFVILSDKVNVPDTPDWYMNVWDHAVETDFDYHNIKDFNCHLNRGNSQNSLFILNHFVTRAGFRRIIAKKANTLDNLVSRSQQCENEHHKVVNFLTVDFYRTGQIVEAAQQLNSLLASCNDCKN